LFFLTSPAQVTFDKPWDPDDIKLIVGKSQGEGQGEGRMVHVCKAVLCTNSPVFDKMLAAGVLQIHIDDETVGDIITIMEIIHPPQRVNVITGLFVIDL
jgi:hypothetical protein